MTEKSETPETLLELWKELRTFQHPDPAAFEPTIDRPTQQHLIGQVGGVDIYAYGVRKTTVGYTGQPLRQIVICEWRWFLDQDEAERQARLGMFEKTEEYVAWQWPEAEEADFSGTTYQSRTIDEINGQPLVVYRIVRLAVFGGWYYVLTLSLEEARLQTHENYWLCIGRYRAPTVPAIDPQNLNHPSFPEVVAYRYWTCPYTQEALYRYGVMVPSSRGDYYLEWFGNSTEAGNRHAQAKESFGTTRQSYEYDLLRRAASRAHLKVWAEAKRLDDSDLFSYHSGAASVPVELVSDFRSAFAELNGREERQISVDEYQRATAQLVWLTGKLNLALQEAYLETALKIEDRFLTGRLQQLLDGNLFQCPLCRHSYQVRRSFEETLIFGESLVTCTCPTDGWDRSQKDLPERIEAMFAFDVRQSKFPVSRVPTTGLNSFSPAIVIAELRVKGVTVLRFVAAERNIRWRPAILVDTLALLELDPKDDVAAELVDVWSPVLKAWNDDRYAAAEAALVACTYSQGDTVLCSFARDDRGYLSCKRQKDGVVRIFRLANDLTEADVRLGTYYCRITEIPSVGRNFALVIVRPFLVARGLPTSKPPIALPVRRDSPVQPPMKATAPQRFGNSLGDKLSSALNKK